jgi:hypothetical protein
LFEVIDFLLTHDRDFLGEQTQQTHGGAERRGV